MAIKTYRPFSVSVNVNEPEIEYLSGILKTFNERYGTEFEDMDKVRNDFMEVAKEGIKNQKFLSSFKHTKDEQNLKITSDEVVKEEMLKFLNSKTNLIKLYFDNKDFKEDANNIVFGLMREMLR